MRPSTIVVPPRTWWDVLKQVGACACLLCIPGIFILGWLLPTPKGVTYSSGGIWRERVVYGVCGGGGGLRGWGRVVAEGVEDIRVVGADRLEAVALGGSR